MRFLLKVLGSAVDIDVETRFDDTPLTFASKSGHLDVVRLLVSEGAAINNQTNDSGSTTLFWAAECGHFDVVQFLCENGANVLWRRHDGVSALCIAAWNGSAYIVEYLAEVWSAELNAPTFDVAALNKAVIHGRTDVVRVLLAHNASTSSDIDQQSTLLCQAIMHNRADIAHLLVWHSTDVNTICKEVVNNVRLEVTPLIVAAGCENLEMAKLLCVNGADVEGVGNENETALFFAAAFGKLDIVKNLVARQNANVQSTSSYNISPVDVSVSRYHRDVFECLMSHGALYRKREFLNQKDYEYLSGCSSYSSDHLRGGVAADVEYWDCRAALEMLVGQCFFYRYGA